MVCTRRHSGCGAASIRGGAGVHPPQGAQDLDARVVIVVRLDQGPWRAAGAGAFDHVANGELVVVPLLADTSLLISVFTNLRERMSGHGRTRPSAPAGLRLQLCGSLVQDMKTSLPGAFVHIYAIEHAYGLPFDQIGDRS